MTYGQKMQYADYVEKANAETLAVIQVETAEAAKNIDSILEVPGVDVIFIGRTDLSHSLGVPGQVEHPSVVETVESIAKAVASSSAALGILVSNAQQAREWQARGARYIVTGLEAVLGPACRNYLEQARQ